MTEKQSDFKFTSCLIGMGLFIPAFLVGMIAGAIVFGVIDGIAEAAGWGRMAYLVVTGLAGFIAAGAAASIGAGGAVLAHNLMVKRGDGFSAATGAWALTVLVVLIGFLAAATDPEIPFSANTIGAAVGMIAGAFAGAMKMIDTGTGNNEVGRDAD